MANVLLVDDSTPTLNRLARHFRRWGHEVKTESDAGNVIRAMADQSTDLVVLDVLMLDVDGIDVLRAIRRHALARRITHAPANPTASPRARPASSS